MAWSDAARAAAREARKRNIRLFHGTTENVRRVVPRSFNPRDEHRRATFLTTDPREARLYAQSVSDQRGRRPVVFMVRARDQRRLSFQGTDGRHSTFTTSKNLTRAKRLVATNLRKLVA